MGLYSRAGNDLTARFPLIVAALGGLRSRSVIIDGEAVACDEDGISNFDRLRHRHHEGSVFLYAFDLIELNSADLRREPLEVRKATLASLLTKARPGIRFNEHIEADGPTVFAHACKMGLEGIVSKCKGSTYRSGRSRDWLDGRILPRVFSKIEAGVVIEKGGSLRESGPARGRGGGPVNTPHEPLFSGHSRN